MKKTQRIRALCCFIAAAACFCFSLSSCGKSDKGFTWTVDDNAKTITVEGIGRLPEVNTGKYPDATYGDYTLIFGDGITGVSNSFRFGKSAFIGRSMNDISPLMTTDWAYEVHEENPFYASYNDALYSKDFTQLLEYPRYKEPNDFHPSLEKIGSMAFEGYCGPNGEGGTVDTIIIPWGVTNIGNQILQGPSTNVKYVIPDTALHIGTASGAGDNQGFYPIWIPSRNNQAAWDAWRGESDPMSTMYIENNYGELGSVPYHNIASYYGILPNSLKVFQNGKTYYFDQHYNMVRGWTEVAGDWYYFNDYGAAAVKTWLERDGKFYFVQEDGSMAKNKWVEWYNEWYYVGADGARYVNQKTPDGHRVNGDGVRVD